ncbi:MAG: alpha/beta hydrolase [Bacteroidales bacterium]|jgi:acetyl esterase/lipase|nr:alpha/beta hydrolase [Bacteroidales bacterium]
MKKCLLLLTALLIFSKLSAQQKVGLWKDVPTMKTEKAILHVYEPADSLRTGVSIIVCPGGSYAHLAGIAWEGFNVAKWLKNQGISAFVLQYRTNNKGYNHPAMIQDVQRAIQWVKEHSAQYQIDTGKVGVMGFSAGGHLSLMAGIFYDENYLQELTPTTVSLKPAFVVSAYPVVSMQDDLAHFRSRKSLLGKQYTKEMQDKFSMEKQIFSAMPPVFLMTTKDDPVVKYENSALLAGALQEAGVDHQFLLYDMGGHGFGMNAKRSGEASAWNLVFKDWLMKIGILKY